LPIRFDRAGGAVRELRVIGKEQASDDVTSFFLEARDGGPLPSFAAGQHLPIEVEVPRVAQPVARTYSISNGPGAPFYRLSVKREPHGLVSRHLHDAVSLGDFISARQPAGDFTLTHEGTRPIVLLSAGVGITPMISMLHELIGGSGGRMVWFIHGARDGSHHPLADEVALHAKATDHFHLHVAYSQPRVEDELGRDYHSEGRIDVALLKKVLPNLDADYYVCGPVSFMATVHEGLESEGVDSENIRSESFGPRPTSRKEN